MTCIGRPSLSSGRGAELVEAERGFFVQLFSELYPLSVTLAGDSSPLGEPSLALLVMHLASLMKTLQFASRFLLPVFYYI